MTSNHYFYKVAGVSPGGVGLDSPVATIAPPVPVLLAWLDRPAFDPSAPPDAVPDLAAESIKRRVRLTWKVARRGWTYDVLRAMSEGGPYARVASGLDTTHWGEDGLDFGHQYFYAVVAVGRDGAHGPQAAPVSVHPVDDTIPTPWKGADIGDVGAEGTDGFLHGAFSIRGAGGDIWGSADAFHFVSQSLTGDGTVIAHLAGQEAVNDWAKAGLMMRETLDGNSQNAFVFQAPAHGMVFQSRTGTGGGTNSTADRSGFSPSPWLKLVRVGSTFTASASRDGAVWTQIGTAEISMSSTVFVGLVTLSHVRGSLGQSRFDNVEVRCP